MTFLTLDAKGVAIAIVLGVLLLAFGRLNPIFTVFMIYFLVLSAAVTVLGVKYKKRIKVYEKSRGVWNVLSNGLGPLIFAALFFISAYFLAWQLMTIFAIAFGASVASITADKFSSEVGVLNGKPKDIFTLKSIKKGRSGGVSALGLSSGLLGAALISIPFAYFALNYGVMPLLLIGYLPLLAMSLTIGGFVGTLVDSMMGHFEEKKLGNKFTSNFICSVCGGAAGVAIFALLLYVLQLPAYFIF
ncbi:MAG: DUF92 domain-containing protein [Candidatus Marsarchaeota archaeon]|jgi:uncharacterized protein (TIGR00297 family)|nr:DUF92 domain-containing protein [Candidatus Marsarchaeota archaeon]MCL5115328.1 DUF92 domain-containing protein [Candidatus Marsarchaeota archaeon]